jgi:hypothetical protein
MRVTVLSSFGSTFPTRNRGRPRRVSESRRVQCRPDMLLVRWTIYLALACYAVVVAGEIAGLTSPRWRRVSRWLWSVGCLAFLGHVATAFHVYLDWSHEAVVRLTARSTQQTIGVAFGEGIYFSYLFTSIWAGDCLWWWWQPTAYLTRPRWSRLAIHGYLFFIAVNGAVVFEAGVTRSIGLLCCTGFALLFAARRFRSRVVAK